MKHLVCDGVCVTVCVAEGRGGHVKRDEVGGRCVWMCWEWVGGGARSMCVLYIMSCVQCVLPWGHCMWSGVWVEEWGEGGSGRAKQQAGSV